MVHAALGALHAHAEWLHAQQRTESVSRHCLGLSRVPAPCNGPQGHIRCRAPAYAAVCRGTAAGSLSHTALAHPERTVVTRDAGGHRLHPYHVQSPYHLACIQAREGAERVPSHLAGEEGTTMVYRTACQPAADAMNQWLSGRGGAWGGARGARGVAHREKGRAHRTHRHRMP